MIALRPRLVERAGAARVEEAENVHGAQHASKTLRRDGRLARVIDHIGPCTLRPRRRHFAALCEAIVWQQLSAKAAKTIYGRFLELFPRRTPTPERLLRLRNDELRRAGLSGQKTRYLRDLAGHFIDGSIASRRLSRLPDDEVISTLTEVRGIGVWTAQMFLIFVLGRRDVLPVDDLGLRKSVQNLYELPGLPESDELSRIAAPWRPYRSIATWYLWEVADNKPMA